jgi:glycosyltransferase involved in cell wall biosynthesis
MVKPALAEEVHRLRYDQRVERGVVAAGPLLEAVDDHRDERGVEPPVFRQAAHGPALAGFELEPIEPAIERWRYRNKLEYSFGEDESGELVLGFHRPGRFDVIDDVTLDILASERVDELREVVKAWCRQEGLSAWDRRGQRGLLRNLVVREGRRTGRLQAVKGELSALLIDLGGISPGDVLIAEERPCGPSGSAMPETLPFHLADAGQIGAAGAVLHVFEAVEQLVPDDARKRRGAGMRIALHVPRASYLEPGTSGDPIFLHALIEGLRERGHQVEIASHVDVRDYWRGRRSARELLSELVSVRTRMERFGPDAWLVYGASATYPDIFGWWQRPQRYVLMATGIGKPERMARPWRWLFAKAHRRSLSRADIVAVYRPKSRRSLQALGVEERRIHVLPLASPSWPSVPPRDEARRRLALPLDAPVVLSVSRLPEARADGRPWKTEMVLELLESGTSLPPQAILVHVGDGPGRKRVDEAARKLGLDGRVRLAGAVEHRDAVWYFAACDFFALPDLRDFPWLAVLEAQACGRPVVTTRTSSAELTVDEGRTGLLAADRREFEAHMRALALDPARCVSMGAAAREYVERTHSLEVRLRQIEDLLTRADDDQRER